MLWPDGDEADRARNAENRRVIERVVDRTLPADVSQAAAERAKVVAELDAAVADVRAMTRDASSYPMLKAENAEYGMWRNLRGVRTYGRLVAGLALIAAVVLIALSVADRVTSSTAELVVGLLAIAALAAFWWLIPTEQRIRQAAGRYALALLDAARLLSHAGPASAPQPPGDSSEAPAT
jgi:hypothetical protein